MDKDVRSFRSFVSPSSASADEMHYLYAVGVVNYSIVPVAAAHHFPVELNGNPLAAFGERFHKLCQGDRPGEFRLLTVKDNDHTSIIAGYIQPAKTGVDLNALSVRYRPADLDRVAVAHRANIESRAA